MRANAVARDAAGGLGGAEAGRGVTRLAALYQEHERCGDLDSGLDGDRVWMTCTSGAVINRWALIDQRGRLLRPTAVC
jgi:hypothetical protein